MLRKVHELGCLRKNIRPSYIKIRGNRGVSNNDPRAFRDFQVPTVVCSFPNPKRRLFYLKKEGSWRPKPSVEPCTQYLHTTSRNMLGITKVRTLRH